MPKSCDIRALFALGGIASALAGNWLVRRRPSTSAMAALQARKGGGFRAWFMLKPGKQQHQPLPQNFSASPLSGRKFDLYDRNGDALCASPF